MVMIKLSKDAVLYSVEKRNSPAIEKIIRKFKCFTVKGGKKK